MIVYVVTENRVIKGVLYTLEYAQEFSKLSTGQVYIYRKDMNTYIGHYLEDTLL